MAEADEAAWDYVIVGSGAGGATLAARLAENGMRVFVLEAGGDAAASGAPELPEQYEVPGLHPFACENPAMAWNFRVRHYEDEARQARDPKYEPGRGVLYPRAATLGGCTAHNAMIYLLPHESDWDHIAALTQDPSWSAAEMRRHARGVEACGYRPGWKAMHRLGLDRTGHGWDGWLSTEVPHPPQVLGDAQLLRVFGQSSAAFARDLRHPARRLLHWLRGAGDPNARTWDGRGYEGLCYTPLSTHRHQRRGARERLLQAREKHRERLHIELDALAVRVILDDDGVARGVEYLRGARLYRAHVAPSSAPGETRQVRARREVILCGGSFNTPQLLMLSGIGAAAQLRAHGIAPRVDLPGVGRNLQDRYEVALTHRMREPWQVLAGARFARGDRLWDIWHRTREGMYASSGAALGVIARSASSGLEPDLFCMALPVRFEGYFDDFSHLIRQHLDCLSWIVLKAHTRNRAGTVELASADPRDPPRVNFRYFEEGSDAAGEDLAAVVQGIRHVRRLTARLIAEGVIAEELAPGPAVDTDAALADYVRSTAWGHHASGTCAIGPAKDGGVLGGDFAVHGTRGLRVVDASVFPRIPGLFIASAVYTVAEKAAATLLAEAAREPAAA
jgi:choline dehydrogenase-like flavoprotein